MRSVTPALSTFCRPSLRRNDRLLRSGYCRSWLAPKGSRGNEFSGGIGLSLEVGMWALTHRAEYGGRADDHAVCAAAHRRCLHMQNHLRPLIVAAALSPLLLSVDAFGQPARRMHRIGGLTLLKSDSEQAKVSRGMFRESLQRAGWEVGRNLVIESRSAEGEVVRLDALAEELVRLDVELIGPSLNASIAAAQRATNTIPIVMVGAVLPVELGFVQSLARPGGNVTGTTTPGPEVLARAIQLLKEVVPSLTRLAALYNPTSPGAQRIVDARSRAASALGMSLQRFPVTQPDEIAAALELVAASRAEMLIVISDGVTESRLPEIATFALQHKIVSVAGGNARFPSLGGAIFYGSNIQEIVYRSMSYVDRILRGAKPADLPVEEPLKFDLIINLKTLRAIGITVPPSVLLRADEVIQ